MTTPPRLNRFTDFNQLRYLNRSFLTRLLEQHRDCLPLEAAALLDARLDHEGYCAAWAAQFKASGTLGAPLLQVLSAIESLALPQNSALLEDALSHLPSGYEVNRDFPPLHQALHLWLITQARLGVPWPLPTPTPPKTDNPQASPPTEPTTKPADQAAANATTNAVREPASPATHQVPCSIDDVEAERVCFDLNQPASRLEAELSTHPDEGWPEPITDGPALFDAVHGRFTKYICLPAGGATVCTLFLGHCHGFSAFHYTPRLNIRSDKESSGKTTTMKVIKAMAPRPFPVHNLRPPVVYRVTHRCQPTPPTILFDEIENYLPLYRELLGLLNAGNSSDVCVPRCEGKTVHVYKPFAPVVLAGIGDLFRTLRSRSILIHMTEAPEEVRLARFDPGHLEVETELRQKLARWAADNLKRIAACDPPLPKAARNRLADNWRPLFQIAHVAGGRWPQLAVEAFHALNPAICASSPSSSSSSISRIHHELLADVRRIFSEPPTDRIHSRDLRARLIALPNRPWCTLLDGKPITNVWLGRHLRRLGLCPKSIWIDGRSGKGFLQSELPD